MKERIKARGRRWWRRYGKECLGVARKEDGRAWQASGSSYTPVSVQMCLKDRCALTSVLKKKDKKCCFENIAITVTEPLEVASVKRKKTKTKRR